MSLTSNSNAEEVFPGPKRVGTFRNEAWSKRNLLSLDGGGIRGYWTLLVLEKLMEFIAEEEEKQGRESSQDRFDSFWPVEWPENIAQYAGQPIPHNKLRNSQKYLPCHYFDFICGTSTGGLIAIMLSRFRMNVEDCLKEYENLSNRIFGKPRWCSQRNIGIVPWSKYSAKSMEKVFKDVTRRRCESSAWTQDGFHAPTFPTTPNTCATFVTTLRRTKNEAGVHPDRLYIIRSYDNCHEPSVPADRYNYGKSARMELWEVARAATAAPMYFDEFKVYLPEKFPHEKIYFSDGGFGVTNNPTQVGIQEVRTLFGNECMGAIVSVGTARARTQPPGKSLLKRVKMFASTGTDPNIVANGLLYENPEFYWRFNDEKGLDIELDDWKPNGWTTKHPGEGTLKKIRNGFFEWAGDMRNMRAIEACARELVTRRRSRLTDTSRWQRFASGALQYRCRHKDCGETHYDSLQLFNDHLEREHEDSEADEYRQPIYERWTYQNQDGNPATRS